MSEPKVFPVVLNMQRREDTLACLASVRSQTYANQQTIVLDLGSTDADVAAIAAACPEVQIVRLDNNLGYAGNNNIGIKLALAQGADWVFILNEDTLLAPDCLSQMLAVAQRDPTIGILGPLVYHYDEPAVIQSAGGMLDAEWNSVHLGKNEVDAGQFQDPHAVDWISGCAILVSRAVIEDIGLIDERFFCYWEETDWCYRAGRGGWQIVQVPAAKLWHKGVQRNYQPHPYVTYYLTRNRLLVLAKHHAPPTAWAGATIDLARTLTSWTVRPKWRAMHEHRNAMWHGAVDFVQRRWGPMPARKAG